MVGHTFGNAPTWFKEGLAKYYGSFDMEDDRKARRGELIGNHLLTFRSRYALRLVRTGLWISPSKDQIAIDKMMGSRRNLLAQTRYNFAKITGLTASISGVRRGPLYHSVRLFHGVRRKDLPTYSLTLTTAATVAAGELFSGNGSQFTERRMCGFSLLESLKEEPQ